MMLERAMSTPSRRATLIFSAIYLVLSAWQIAIGNLDFSASGLGTLAAAGATIALYSFLYDDNPLFKMAENLYVGVSLGYTAGLTWYNLLLPDLVQPLLLAPERDLAAWSLLIPAAMGIMMVLQVVPSVSWISRISFAFVVGLTAGLSITANISAQLLEQIYPTLAPPAGAWPASDIWMLAIFAALVIAGFYFLRGRNTSEEGFMHSWIGPVGLTAVFALCFFLDIGTAALIMIPMVIPVFKQVARELKPE